jgi:hypothetical protein
MSLRIGIVLALVLLPAPPAEAKEEALDVLAAEPFVLDFAPDRPPAGATVVDRRHPLALQAARGHEVAGMLVLAAGADQYRLEVRSGALRSGKSEIGPERVSIAVIRTVFRTPPLQGRVVAARYPEAAGRGFRFPEILVRNEPAFLEAAAAGKRPLPDEDEEAPVRLAPMRAGRVKHLLVTVSVPEDAAPGEYSGDVTVGKTAVPIALTVLGFRLEPHEGVVLGVGNRFARHRGEHLEASLDLLRRIGMNCTRFSDLTSMPEPEVSFYLLEEYGFRHVIQEAPVRAKGDLERVPSWLDLHVRGREFPVPTEDGGWRRMAEHVRLSARMHGFGSRMMTTLPFPFAVALADRRSSLYKHVAKAGAKGLYAPLDWASYPLDLERIGKKDSPNRELLAYLTKLRKKPRGARATGKNAWRETLRFSPGMDRYPFFSRLVYGFFLFQSRLDGVEGWTLNWTHGLDPFADGPEPVVTLAHAGETMLYSSLTLEAIREGVVDLRYAQQAHRAVERLRTSTVKEEAVKGRLLLRRFVKLLEPWERLVSKGRRVDLASSDPERRLRETREALAELILEAGS